MPRPLNVLQTQAWDFWLARGSVLIIVGLQLVVSRRLTLGPTWLAPVLELALLIPLSAGTALTLGRVRAASTEAHWQEVQRLHDAGHWLAIILTGLVSLANLSGLVLLVRAMVGGHAGTGATLLVDAASIWMTNVFAFALWFWNLDRGGPATGGLGPDEQPDFLFSNMLPGATVAPRWSPGFVDYLYLSFTTATALSPADTLPLSQPAKLLMMLEAGISLTTIAIVAGRAVNILP